MIEELEADIAKAATAEIDRQKFFDVLYSVLVETFAENPQRDQLLSFYTPQVRALADTVELKFNDQHQLVIDRERLAPDGRNMAILLERGSHNLDHLYQLSELALVSA